MESMEAIKQFVNADHDQPGRQAQGTQAKKPYIAPTLTRLGTVKQITEGAPFFPIPDTIGDSIG